MRETFHDQLEAIRSDLVDMSERVATAMARATRALLEADVSLADSVISDDEIIDETRNDLEERAFELLARQQPVAVDLRVVVASLRMVTEIERMGDLALHIAKVARLRYPESAVPEDFKSTFAEMGRLAGQVIAKAGQVIRTRDEVLARELEADDDLIDDLHQALFRRLVLSSHSIETAIDVTLLGRYYERFGDHAVSVARRVVYLVTGAYPETVAH
ncbi:MAG: phosphate signaling complex protein PhoU [Mycobacteriales bacterium]